MITSVATRGLFGTKGFYGLCTRERSLTSASRTLTALSARPTLFSKAQYQRPHERHIQQRRGELVRCYSQTSPTMMATGEEMMLTMSNGDRKSLVGKDLPLAMESFVNADCVCFDVDSTVIQEEGIDVLADYLGKGQAVADLTKQAMDGGMKFEDALAARLELLQPSLREIESCLEERPFQLTPGIKELVERLHDANKTVWFVSGGFRVMIEPIAEELQIPPFNIYANTIFFRPEDGDDDIEPMTHTNIYDTLNQDFLSDDVSTEYVYAGFDDTEPTSQDMGKAKALEKIQQRHAKVKKTSPESTTLVMIGDGYTDSQAKPPAAAFIGFGGVAVREKVQNAADWYITDFHDLIRLLDEFPNQNYNPFFPDWGKSDKE